MSVVTIGFFDGLHLGHQSIISRLIKEKQDKEKDLYEKIRNIITKYLNPNLKNINLSNVKENNKENYKKKNNLNVTNNNNYSKTKLLNKIKNQKGAGGNGPINAVCTCEWRCISSIGIGSKWICNRQIGKERY